MTKVELAVFEGGMFVQDSSPVSELRCIRFSSTKNFLIKHRGGNVTCVLWKGNKQIPCHATHDSCVEANVTGGRIISRLQRFINVFVSASNDFNSTELAVKLINKLDKCFCVSTLSQSFPD